MKLLYVGDVMAQPGRAALAEFLPKVRQEHNVDFVIVQAENSSDDGKGPGASDIEAMQQVGADFFTGGNHSLYGVASDELYDSDTAPVTRPANLIGAKGSGWKVAKTSNGNVLVVSLLGQTVGNRQPKILNPLVIIDEILEATANQNITARIVNFHGDFSSEKRVIGYYLDGRVSAVVGDHWHVPSADALVLPKGTAHVTDVGMCGTLHSSLGVSLDTIIYRWKTGKPTKNSIETQRPWQFNAVLVNIDERTGLARSIERIQYID